MKPIVQFVEVSAVVVLLLGALLACKKEEPAPAATPSAGGDTVPAATKSDADSCPKTGTFESGKDEVTCSCAPGSDKGGPVWGSDVYTTDSDPCVAAAHAGVITSGGGKITFKSFSQCPSFRGSERNGVKTGDWGSYPTTFYFPSKGSPSCATAEKCPLTLLTVPAGKDFSLSCTCEAGLGGTVYGTNMYTTDSSVCAAARHAGAIDQQGGTVELKTGPGCPKYTGTTRNGVSTTSWGSYPASFYFPSKHSGQCP